MNTRQQQALQSLRRQLQDTITANSAERYGKQITTWDVKPTEYGSVWVTAEIECAGLPENNLLRAVEREYWLVLIGPRGARTAHMYPRSLEQFKGKRWCFINIK